MKTIKVTMTLSLYEGSTTDWIEKAIEEQLEVGEVILDGNIEDVEKLC
jgi:uncharacterized Zn finger protein